MTTLTITNAVMDIRATQGKTWRIHIALTDSVGAAVTATDCRWQARTNTANASTVLDLTTSTGITLGAGTIDIVASATVTASIAAGRYVHEIEIHTSATEVPPFLSGVLTVEPEVAR